jgi:hypothetical protein
MFLMRKARNDSLAPRPFVPNHLSGWVKCYAVALHATYVRKRHGVDPQREVCAQKKSILGAVSRDMGRTVGVMQAKSALCVV